jgi:hypothetical protein
MAAVKETKGGAARSRHRRERPTYERPAIISRERLEGIAGVCSPGKASGQPGDCFLNTNS